MRSDRAKTVAALVTMAGALSLLYFSMHEAAPKVDSRPHEALGQVVAEEAARLLGSGGRLTLITRDTAIFQNPYADAEVRGFQQALRNAKLTLSTTNLLKQDPLRLVRVPPGDFLQIMKKQSESDVIVSLLGPPVLSGEQRATLGESKPRIVAVCSGEMLRQVNLRELFDQNLLHVAVISRPHPSPKPAVSSNLRDAFDQLYQVITKENLSELPPVTQSVTK